MRKNARVVVYKVLYSELFGNTEPKELMSELLIEEKCSKADTEFAERLHNCVTEHIDELDDIISELAYNYKLERVFSTDRCALLIGLCEMKYFDDIPNIVAIDEALDLCRVYSTSKSLSFVNGIFAEFKRRIEA